jgi:hypothetical protein
MTTLFVLRAPRIRQPMLVHNSINNTFFSYALNRARRHLEKTEHFDSNSNHRHEYQLIDAPL